MSLLPFPVKLPIKPEILLLVPVISISPVEKHPFMLRGLPLKETPIKPPKDVVWEEPEYSEAFA